MTAKHEGTVNPLVETPIQHASKMPRISHAALLMASQVAKWTLRLIFVLVVARGLGPEKLGAYALLFTMVEFLGVASGAGYSDYLTREAAKDAAAGWGLAIQLVALRMTIAVLLAMVEMGILFVMRYPHSVLAGTAWMALSIIPRSISEAVQGVLRGTHRYGSSLVIDLVLGGSLVTGAVVLLMRHGQVGTAICIEVIAASAAGIASAIFALNYLTKERIWLSPSELIKRSAIFNVYSFIVNLYDRFDVVLLSKFAGDYATGIYSIAYRAVSMTQILGYSVLYSLLPTLSRDGLGPTGRRRLENAMGLLLSVGFFVVLATMVFAGPAIGLVLGSQYAESAEALKILVWAILFRYVNYALNIALLAAGRERVFVVTSSVCLGINLVGNLALIPRFGWRAAALLTIVTEVALLAQNLYWIRRAREKVAPPLGMARTSLVFGVLLVLAVAGGRLGSPLLVGTGCLVFFAWYLCRSGMTMEIAAVWDAA